MNASPFLPNALPPVVLLAGDIICLGGRRLNDADRPEPEMLLLPTCDLDLDGTTQLSEPSERAVEEAYQWMKLL